MRVKADLPRVRAAAHGDESFGDRTALARVNRGLDRARRQGRFPGDGRGELAGGAHQRAERGEPIDEAERKRFLSFDPPAGQHELHGQAYARLQEIKRKYDPTNLFRMNQNIKPA